MGSGAPDGQFPRTVKHFAGETTIDAEPKRVVVLGTGQIDVLLTLGVVPAGSAASEKDAVVPQYLLDTFPQSRAELTKVAYVGERTEPDADAIRALKPDLILLNAEQSEETDMYQMASGIAPTVAAEGTGLNWKQDMLLAADAIGRTGAAQTWLDDYHARTAGLSTSLDRSTTVTLARENSDETVRLYALGSFSGSIVSDLGLARPASQQITERSVDVEPDQLGEAEADWIFYGLRGEEKSFTALPQWSALSAVKNDQAISVDIEPWYMNAGPSAAKVVVDDIETNLAP